MFGKFSSRFRKLSGDVVDLRNIADVNNQRIEKRPLFQPEDFRYRLGLINRRGQSVNRFSGNGDNFATGEQIGGGIDIDLVDIERQRSKSSSFFFPAHDKIAAPQASYRYTEYSGEV